MTKQVPVQVSCLMMLLQDSPHGTSATTTWTWRPSSPSSRTAPRQERRPEEVRLWRSHMDWQPPEDLWTLIWVSLKLLLILFQRSGSWILQIFVIFAWIIQCFIALQRPASNARQDIGWPSRNYHIIWKYISRVKSYFQGLPSPSCCLVSPNKVRWERLSRYLFQ